MEKTAPWEPWKTLRVSHLPKGSKTINYLVESGPNCREKVTWNESQREKPE